MPGAGRKQIAAVPSLAATLQNIVRREISGAEDRITARIERLETALLERPASKPDARYGAALRAALDDIAIAINEQNFLNKR